MLEELKNMTDLKAIALSALAVAAMTGCGDTNITYGDSTVTITGDTITPDPEPDPDYPTAPEQQQEVIGFIMEDATWTADTAWIMNGRITVTNGATLTIEPGTFIAGKNTDSFLLIDKDAKLMAEGTSAEPIRFSSVEGLSAADTTVGKWGGVTLIGNANMSGTQLSYEVDPTYIAGEDLADDSSGVLTHVTILNSATEVEPDRETNGLSFVGVGSGTVVQDITVDYSGDDGVEIWGGTVNLENVSIANCTDDHLDVDSMYVGTITNLTIDAAIGYAAIEMSGTGTILTLDEFTINVDGFAENSSAEGGIFFKKAGVGGKFYNGTINYNSTFAGAVFSQQIPELANIDFANVTINTAGAVGDYDFVDQTDDATDGATEIRAIFDADVTNTVNYN